MAMSAGNGGGTELEGGLGFASATRGNDGNTDVHSRRNQGGNRAHFQRGNKKQISGMSHSCVKITIRLRVLARIFLTAITDFLVAIKSVFAGSGNCIVRVAKRLQKRQESRAFVRFAADS